ncbi:molybdopterin molybdotransferase MoeA [Neoroseomonas oryzicola]|uniref:Molybdopterin molybdenumtransferase n=1 Tax=Neoroseomonas oryzicola TaxID=535904 RepID=A0A9X9WIT1_9PROT|nr:gephyrin-like molybdotransferase Glp [Neoroseomonas oryzicola]MBR0660241.1 molybdopterin molybdotransferase MoeA [Neoroseomonas oryzicola]NKE16684.1 molybdopterin molybdotransferase MoeA [Neoroseomonas oryzicola]
MAQLSDDCFAFGGALMSVEEAQALIAERVPPAVAAEQVPLAAARGRVLARDLVASIPLPPFFNAAVDGWAFRHDDLAYGSETRLDEAGRVAAGHVPARPVGQGEAVRVFTGAPMPYGTDTCVMQEDVRHTGRSILVPDGLKRGANARPAGEDVAKGSVALTAGRLLGPAEIGLAAALGQRTLAVRRRPRIGVFSTGDELMEPGSPLGPARTYDSNRFTLLALLAGLPCEAVDLGILPDDREHTAQALAAAAGHHDLLLTSGGVSTGEEDHVRAAIGTQGRLVFWRLAVKPGRPAAMGVVAGTPVVGLPGNPVAAVVCFLHLARPLLMRLAGAADRPLPRVGAVADFAYRKKAGRREYVRVTLATQDGLTTARKFPREGAGLLSSLTESDGFAELPEAVTEVAPGDRLTVLPFAGIL